MSVTVRAIDPAEHRVLVARRPPRSFLQTPGWAGAKPGWTPRSIAWFDDGELAGTALALLRPIPHSRRTFAYLPDGPDLDWEQLSADARLPEYLDPLVGLLRAAGCFAIRIGPQVPVRTWSATTVKRALAERAADAGAPGRLAAVAADSESQRAVAVSADLMAGGWQPPADTAGFGTGQPRYTFRLPLAGRTEAELLGGFNQLWRRSVRAATKAGVSVHFGGPADLAAFHRLYAETADRDGFTPRAADYFHRMWAGLAADDPDRIRLYLASVDGELAAATLFVTVGAHSWYSYGASSTHLRETRASQAVQWQMIRDARDGGSEVYDLRGITDTLDPADSHVGLLRFKVGTGGQAVVTLGEWDLPLNRLLHRALSTYLDRR